MKTILFILAAVLVVYGILLFGDSYRIKHHNNSTSSQKDSSNTEQIIVDDSNTTNNDEEQVNSEDDSLFSGKNEFISVGTGTIKLKKPNHNISTVSTLSIKK